MQPETDRTCGLTVVIPAYNEAEAIAETLTSVKQALSMIRRPSEVLVVDDGSTDDTAALALTVNVRVIRHPINGGYGRALFTGIEAATYDTVVIVDADGTYPIEYLPNLVSLYDRGFDMVVGARQGHHYEGTLGKKMLRVIFRFLVEFASGRSIPDINSGFRAFTRTPVLAARASLSSGFSFTATITLLFLLNHLFVGYLPIPYNKRVGKSRVNLFLDGLRSLQIIITAFAQYNPVKLGLLLLLLNLGGNLILAILSLGLLLVVQSFWVILAMAWNTAYLIMGFTLLALALLRRTGRLSFSTGRSGQSGSTSHGST